MNILGALHESLTRRKYLKSEVLNFGLLLTVARTSTFQFLYQSPDALVRTVETHS